MKDIIKILEEDHKKITKEIYDIENLLNLKPEDSFSRLAEKLSSFRDFTFKGHHLREDEILYAWMRSQNSNSDTVVMDRIKSEHNRLEKLGDKIYAAIQNSLNSAGDTSQQIILGDLKDFITLYFEHMDKEEKFIFMIAEGLNLGETEQKAMLKKMQQTLVI